MSRPDKKNRSLCFALSLCFGVWHDYLLPLKQQQPPRPTQQPTQQPTQHKKKPNQPNLNLVEVACTGSVHRPQLTLTVPSPPAPISLECWSPDQAAGTCHFDASYWSSHPVQRLPPLLLLEVSSSQSRSPVPTVTGYSLFPMQRSLLCSFFLLGDTKRQEKSGKQKLSTQFEVAPLPKSLLWL